MSVDPQDDDSVYHTYWWQWSGWIGRIVIGFAIGTALYWLVALAVHSVRWWVDLFTA